MTNFEKIKSMSKEQMTHFMLDIMLDTLKFAVIAKIVMLLVLKMKKLLENGLKVRRTTIDG
jgi:hypothetical protein